MPEFFIDNLVKYKGRRVKLLFKHLVPVTCTILETNAFVTHVSFHSVDPDRPPYSEIATYRSEEIIGFEVRDDV